VKRTNYEARHYTVSIL